MTALMSVWLCLQLQEIVISRKACVHGGILQLEISLIGSLAQVAHPVLSLAQAPTGLAPSQVRI